MSFHILSHQPVTKYYLEALLFGGYEGLNVQLGEDASKKNGGTYFQKPFPARSTFDFGAFYNRETSIDMFPEEGKMLVWPSHLMHGSYPYEGKNDRIIISANAKVSVIQDGKSIRSV